MSLPPVCVACACTMRCVKNDSDVRDRRTPTAEATVWSGDRFECPGCGAQIITGFGVGVPEHRCPDRAAEALEFKRP